MKCRNSFENFLRAVVVVSVLLSCMSLSFAMEVLDLERQEPDVKLQAGQKGKLSSFENLSSGDINGDGKEDVIMIGGISDPGKSTISTLLVFFGRKLKESELGGVATQNTTKTLLIYMKKKPLYPPVAVWVSDINGDLIGDLLISTGEGLSVLFGRKKWPGVIDLRRDFADLRILARKKTEPGKRWSGTVTAGRINQDDIADLIFSHDIPSEEQVSEDLSDNNRPTPRQEVAWLFYGKKSWPQVIDLSKEQADMIISAEQPYPRSRHIRPIRIVDLDLDGFGDIVVGSWGGSEGFGGLGNLKGPWMDWETAWIIPGGEGLPRRIDLNLGGSSPWSKGKEIVNIDPRKRGAHIEGGLVVGDLTGDKIEDLVLSIILKPVSSHLPRRQFCLIAGSTNFFRNRVFDTKKNCIMMSGKKDIEFVGVTGFVPLPTMGDYDGDGREDFFFMTSKQVHFGLFGGESMGRTVDIEDKSNIKVLPPLSIQAGFGFRSKMGDFDGDRKDDLLILSTLESGGTVYVILGKTKSAPNRETTSQKKLGAGKNHR